MAMISRRLSSPRCSASGMRTRPSSPRGGLVLAATAPTGGWRGHPNAEVPQHAFLYGQRCARQRVEPRLRLGERDHLADVVLTRQDRYEAIQSHAEAGVRRRAIRERVEQVTEPHVGFVG